MAKKRRKSLIELIFSGPPTDAEPYKGKGLVEQIAYGIISQETLVEDEKWSLNTIHGLIRDAFADQWTDGVPANSLESFTIEIAETFERYAEKGGFKVYWFVRDAKIVGDISIKRNLSDKDVKKFELWRDKAIKDVLG